MLNQNLILYFQFLGETSHNAVCYNRKADRRRNSRRRFEINSENDSANKYRNVVFQIGTGKININFYFILNGHSYCPILPFLIYALLVSDITESLKKLGCQI